MTQVLKENRVLKVFKESKGKLAHKVLRAIQVLKVFKESKGKLAH